MAIEPPRIDKRSSKDLLKEIKSLIPFYTAEWHPKEKDVSHALVKIFCQMIESIIQHLNKVPEKNFIAFLDRIGIKLLPAQSATVPITFYLAEGAEEHILIPEKTQVASGDIVFETEKNMLATPSKLTKIYSTNPRDDGIYESPNSVISKEPLIPFNAKLLYEAKIGSKEIFLTTTEGLNEGDTLIISGFEYTKVSEILNSRVKLIHKLEDDHDADSPVEKANSFDLFEGRNLQEHILYLGHDDLFNLKNPAEIRFQITPQSWTKNLSLEWCYWDCGLHFVDYFSKDELTESIWSVISYGKGDVTLKSGYLEIARLEYAGWAQKGICFKQRLDFTKGETFIEWSVCLAHKEFNVGFLDRKVLDEDPWSFPICLITTERYEINNELKQRTVVQTNKNITATWPSDKEQSPVQHNAGIGLHTYKAIFKPLTEERFNFTLIVDGEQSYTNEMTFGDVDPSNIYLHFYVSNYGQISPKISEKVHRFTAIGHIVISNSRDKKMKMELENDNLITFGGNKQTKIREINSHWICCKLTEHLTKPVPFVDIIKVAVKPKYPLYPDLCFHNDAPLDLSKQFYPFGTKPRLYDTFYISSQEAFSKKDGLIIININASLKKINNQDKSSDLLLSWEYWNGKTWIAIKALKDFTDGFRDEEGREIRFQCPKDIQPVEVNGITNYWIRTRIVNGDYGREEYDNNTGNVIPMFTPPVINNITVTYTAQGNLQHFLAYNNLEFKNVTEENKSVNKSFMPFQPLDDKYQTLYLGFDKKLKKGPIGLFFLIEEQPWSVDKLPIIEWEYYAGQGKWVRLDMLDETMNLTRTGVIEFAFPQDFEKTKRFGKDLYWIRAVNVKDSLKPIKRVYFKFFPYFQQIKMDKPQFKLRKQIIDGYLVPAVRQYKPQPLMEFKIKQPPWRQFVRIFRIEDILSMRKKEEKPCSDLISKVESCPEPLEIFHPEWDHPEEVRDDPMSPKIKNIFLNTNWAVQAETIKDEFLGSSDGTDSQTFTLAKSPVITEEIWVNEIRTIPEEERKTIIEEEEYEAREIKDEKENITEFWIRWKPVEDHLVSTEDSRHYEIDRVSGEVKFGDGIHGKIPPIGTDNIIANYRAGGGSKGNLPAYQVKDLKSSIPFVDKAINPLAAGGGANAEAIEKTLERGPQVLKHRNRAVTDEDFEQIACKASRAVARAKCLANFDLNGEFKTGWVTVLIIPQSSEDRPKLSLQLKKKVENFLREHSANTVVEKSHLQVSEPLYVEVCVSTNLITTSIELIPIVEKKAFSTLKKFLHPTTGGYEGKGWEFGRLPCVSDFIAFLEKVDGVSYVDKFSLKLRTYAEDRVTSEFTITPEEPADIEMPSYTIIYSGEHNITVSYKKSASEE